MRTLLRHALGTSIALCLALAGTIVSDDVPRSSADDGIEVPIYLFDSGFGCGYRNPGTLPVVGSMVFTTELGPPGSYPRGYIHLRDIHVNFPNVYEITVQQSYLGDTSGCRTSQAYNFGPYVDELVIDEWTAPMWADGFHLIARSSSDRFVVPSVTLATAWIPLPREATASSPPGLGQSTAQRPESTAEATATAGDGAVATPTTPPAASPQPPAVLPVPPRTGGAGLTEAGTRVQSVAGFVLVIVVLLGASRLLYRHSRR